MHKVRGNKQNNKNGANTGGGFAENQLFWFDNQGDWNGNQTNATPRNSFANPGDWNGNQSNATPGNSFAGINRQMRIPSNRQQHTQSQFTMRKPQVPGKRHNAPRYFMDTITGTNEAKFSASNNNAKYQINNKKFRNRKKKNAKRNDSNGKWVPSRGTRQNATNKSTKFMQNTSYPKSMSQQACSSGTEATIAPPSSTEVVDLNSAVGVTESVKQNNTENIESEMDDDVIMMPPNPVPIIDLSDDTSVDGHEFAKPQNTTAASKDTSRCSSPAASVQSVNSFITQKDCQKVLNTETSMTNEENDENDLDEEMPTLIADNSNPDATKKRTASISATSDVLIDLDNWQSLSDSEDESMYRLKGNRQKFNSERRWSYNPDATGLRHVRRGPAVAGVKLPGVFTPDTPQVVYAPKPDSARMKDMSAKEFMDTVKSLSSGSNHKERDDSLTSSDSSSDSVDAMQKSDDQIIPCSSDDDVIFVNDSGEVNEADDSELSKTPPKSVSPNKTPGTIHEETASQEYVERRPESLGIDENIDKDVEDANNVSESPNSASVQRSEETELDQEASKSNEASEPSTELKNQKENDAKDSTNTEMENSLHNNKSYDYAHDPLPYLEDVAESLRLFDEHVANSRSEEVEEQSYQPFDDISEPDPQPEPEIKQMPLNRGGPLMYICHNYDNDTTKLPAYNEEMRRFYNDSWNGENFTVSALRSQMNRNKNLWKVKPEDMYALPKRNRNIRCHNCCEYGHTWSTCRRPLKSIACAMCGYNGHSVDNCPRARCLNCGEKTRTYVKNCQYCVRNRYFHCMLCNMRGHNVDSCPDKWRRYHSTTQPQVALNNKNANGKPYHCCSCGKRGHLYDKCPENGYLQYPVYCDKIMSYSRSYRNENVPSTNPNTAMTLHYNPNNRVQFTFAQETSPSKYYGRFLKSVGLGQMMCHKRGPENVAPHLPPKKSCRNDAQCQLRGDSEKNPSNELPLSTDEANDMPQMQIDDTNSGDNMIEIDANIEPEDAILISDDDVSIDEQSDQSKPSGEDVEKVNTDLVLNVVALNQLQFKTPDNVETSLSSKTDAPSVSQQMHVAHDSDSNYSFSEHFEVASSKSKATPDFISLNENSESAIPFAEDQNMQETPEDEDGNAKEIPSSNAQIYLTHLNYAYLQSEDGKALLENLSNKHNIVSQMKWTEFGHALQISGTQASQDAYHTELGSAFLNHTTEIARKREAAAARCQVVPKRVDNLIRHLRKEIGSLHKNLGDVQHIYNRLLSVERLETRNACRSADRLKRTLNMILVGKAGLMDGFNHRNCLLEKLELLITNFQPQNDVPMGLRQAIDFHYKKIFSSTRLDYEKLISDYNLLSSSDRIPKQTQSSSSMVINPVDNDNQKETKKEKSAKRKSGSC